MNSVHVHSVVDTLILQNDFSLLDNKMVNLLRKKHQQLKQEDKQSASSLNF